VVCVKNVRRLAAGIASLSTCCDGALKTLGAQTYGVALLLLADGGIITYGLYSFASAIHKNVSESADSALGAHTPTTLKRMPEIEM
jgi:hypothetical protein